LLSVGTDASAIDPRILRRKARDRMEQ